MRKLPTEVRVGRVLKNLVRPAAALERRDGYRTLKNYVTCDSDGRVLILCGFPGTGKTTLICQAIADLGPDDFDRTALVRIRAYNEMDDVIESMRWLQRNDYSIVFLDDITLTHGFANGASILSDICACSGMKVILSGDDPLEFQLCERDELYDRCIMLHMTTLPYREWERVLGTHGIDAYILGDKWLGGESMGADAYVAAATDSMRHALEQYRFDGHLHHLKEIREEGRLYPAIRGVLEETNGRFAFDVLSRFATQRPKGGDQFGACLRDALARWERSRQETEVTEEQRREIRECLDLVDLTVDIPTEFLPASNRKQSRTVVSRPGLRYARAEEMICRLLEDKPFRRFSDEEREEMCAAMLQAVSARLMEDIALLETQTARNMEKVIRLQFAEGGEFDMVVVDQARIECEVYTIRYAAEPLPRHLRHLEDQKNLDEAAFRYGRIRRRALIYLGESRWHQSSIEYLNVEEYLRSL
ncbi:MAG: ATP-binding protein [Clostridia bacterium]|nr:ATP-binding protein [Clostridia bacterium]